jgi:hypothetical protein
MDNLIVNVPFDKRGKYVKSIAERAGVTQFSNDEFGNIQFEVSRVQLEDILNLSGIGTYKIELPGNVISTGLHIDNIYYGQIWHSKEEYDEYKLKTADMY